jgi:hypothetical protein
MPKQLRILTSRSYLTGPAVRTAPNPTHHDFVGHVQTPRSDALRERLGQGRSAILAAPVHPVGAPAPAPRSLMQTLKENSPWKR